MRIELENRFNSKRILLNTPDKKILDCFLIYPYNIKKEQINSKKNKNS